MPARGLGLPCGRLTGHGCPDPDGVTTFHTYELRPGWVPPLPRGRRCSSRLWTIHSRRLPLPSGQSLYPATAFHRRGLQSRGINRGSSNSPVRSSLRLWFPGWNRALLGFPPSFAPHRLITGDARRGRDRPPSTSLELRSRHQPNLQSTCSLITCDLVSQSPLAVAPPSTWGQFRCRLSAVARCRRRTTSHCRARRSRFAGATRSPAGPA